MLTRQNTLFMTAPLVVMLMAGSAFGQWASEQDMIAANPNFPWVDRYESDSAGRGWDFADPNAYEQIGPADGIITRGTHSYFGLTAPEAQVIIAAQSGEVPDGVTQLDRDIFTSDDFYIDRDLWTDPRYFRCNSGIAIESQWGAYGSTLIGDNPPETAAWGFCDRDYPRDAIISPYPFDTAQEHFETLRAEAGGDFTPPEYDLLDQLSGRYHRGVLENWWYMRINQIPTILSLLTDEYQTRMVQEAYHHGNTNAAMWPSSYCWPEGFMRRFSQHGVRTHELLATKNMVQWTTGLIDNMLTHIHVGREFNMEGLVPRIGQDVPRWQGETIGFWDGEALITWTSNIQGWMTHNAFEHSNLLQTVEIYTPMYNEDGSVWGLFHEAVFYDPEALLQPVRQVREMQRAGGFDAFDPYILLNCNQTLFPIDGRAQPVAPNTDIDFTVPDMFGRPWAQIWERYHEQHMQRPEAEVLFGF